MVCAPSMSPEQGPPGTGTMLTAGCTMDTQIVLDALTSVLSATKLLYPDHTSYCDSLQGTIKRLPPMQIGKHNQLQEWLADVDDRIMIAVTSLICTGFTQVIRFLLMPIRSFSKPLSVRSSIGVIWLRDGLSVGKLIFGHAYSMEIVRIQLSKIC